MIFKVEWRQSSRLSHGREGTTDDDDDVFSPIGMYE
jgi:hypothetical protein